jgi:HD-like signal output (HDOD) protein
MIASSNYSEAQLVDLAKQLPSGPRLMAEIGQMLRDPSTDTDEIIHVLRRDAAMVARILRVANSAAFARTEPIGSIEEAVLTIGFAEVHRVVGAIAAFQLGDRPLSLHGISGARFRENALLTACVMKQFANLTGLDPQAFYTAGMLRTLGIILMEREASRNARSVQPLKSSGNQDLMAWQRKNWGVDSSAVTAKILRHWNMPGEIAAAVECHLIPSEFPAREATLLRLAAAVTAREGYGLQGESLGDETESCNQANLDPEAFEDAVGRAKLEFNAVHNSVA